MTFVKPIIVLITLCSFTQAITIELFKSKNPARFNNFGVTMKAKINSIDCNYRVGYGKGRKSCRATAQHQLKGQRDQAIYLVFDKFYASKLQMMQKQGGYRFVSCVYTHKKKLMGDCTIK
jgi:hypothetical protein